MDIAQHARVLWDYHRLRMDLRRADFILAMGSHDLRVAHHAADLWLKGWGELLVVSGGYGKVTGDHWSVPEGEMFGEIARAAGVSEDKLIVESSATNTGENVTKTRELLLSRGLEPVSGLIVTKPYMCRRAYATAAKQWPEVHWQVTSPEIGFDEYPSEDVPFGRMVNLMVGDLQRIKTYADAGFQLPQEIPDDVWASYEYLRKGGFDDFVIK